MLTRITKKKIRGAKSFAIVLNPKIKFGHHNREKEQNKIKKACGAHIQI